jgi:LytS/YehU family sensor histidine kinase
LKARISVDEEVRYISNYLELERVRFGDTFQYDITVAPDIDRVNFHIPPMLLQPYVENSIRHGLRYREDNKGMVQIRFVENASHLICTIEDNGVGRKLARQYKSQLPIEYQSRGMTLTARRMEMMNQGQGAPIVMEIEDMETDDHLPAGTRVTLRFPIQFVKILKPLL